MKNYNINFTEKAKDGDIQRIFSNINNIKLPYAIIETSARSNGIQTATNYEFVRNCADRIRRTGLFSGCTTEFPLQKPENCFILSIYIDETNDVHIGRTLANVGLAVVTYGASLLVTKKKDDFSNAMTMNITRPDGLTRQYHAKSSGSVAKGTFADHNKANVELTMEIINTNICSICNQMVDDSDFFVSNKTSLIKGSILDTPVKGKFCGHCGASLRDGTIFCTQCGKKQ